MSGLLAEYMRLITSSASLECGVSSSIVTEFHFIGTSMLRAFLAHNKLLSGTNIEFLSGNKLWRRSERYGNTAL